MTQKPDTGQGIPDPVGAGEYRVKPGDCVLSVADRAGHHWETLWNHPINSDLKAKRGSPHVLRPGDHLHVPEIRTKNESASTDQAHVFTRNGWPIHFELKVTENGEPLAGYAYDLRIEDRSTEGTVPADGVLRAPMYPQDRTGILRVYVDDKVREYPLKFGQLDPAHTKAGASARLRNLGFLAPGTKLDDDTDGVTRFQREHGLAETGQLDDATAVKLAEVHGS